VETRLISTLFGNDFIYLFRFYFKVIFNEANISHGNSCAADRLFLDEVN